MNIYKIRVISESKKEEVVKKDKNTYVIKVKEKAERNLANNRTREILSSVFKVEKKAVQIIKGHHSPSKLVKIHLPKDLL